MVNKGKEIEMKVLKTMEKSFDEYFLSQEAKKIIKTDLQYLGDKIFVQLTSLSIVR